MEDKGLDFTKPPIDISPPVDRNVPKRFLARQLGCKYKSNLVPKQLQWAAEDKFINKEHKEFKCQLPDVSRSTFLMVFSPDGTKVASTHGNHNVYVTDLTSGKNIKTLTGHPRTPWCIAFHPSSNQILATGCLGGQVRVWDLHGGSEIWTADSQTVIASLAFHPVDRMLVIASYNELHFWDWSQPEPFAKCYTANDKEKVRYVAFDNLGHKLITGVANAPTRISTQWDRVAMPQPPPGITTIDSERRITICYRYMVEQYEHLVQRYHDLSRRARNTPTMDRGTDPMDMELAEPSPSSSSANTSSSSNPSQSPLNRSSSSVNPEVGETGNNQRSDRYNYMVIVPNRRRNYPSTSPTTRLSQSVSPPRIYRRLFQSSRNNEESDHQHSFSQAPQSNEPESNDSPETAEPFIGFAGFDSSERMYNSSENRYHNNICPTETRPNILRSPFIRETAALPPLRPDVNPRNNSGLPRPPILLHSRNRPVRYMPLYRSGEHIPSSSSFDEPQPRVSGLTPETIGFGLRNETETPSPETDSNSPVPLQRELVIDLIRARRQIQSEGRAGVDSDNEVRDVDLPSLPSQSDVEQSFSPLLRYNTRHSIFRQESHTESPTSAPPRRNSEIPSNAVSRLRTQFRRLQTAYNSRPPRHSSHVLSAETEASERRLLSRLNELIERPLETRPQRRFFVSRRSAFQPRSALSNTNNPRSSSNDTNTSSLPLDVSGVHYGIELLSHHIDNMQRLCRARLESLQLQQIRRMWEDLQSQIYALHGVVRDNNESRPAEENSENRSVGESHDNTPETASGSGSRSESESTQRRRKLLNPASQIDVPDAMTDDDSDASNDNSQMNFYHMRRASHQRYQHKALKSIHQSARSLLKRARTHSVNVNKAKESKTESRVPNLPSVPPRRQIQTFNLEQASTSEELPSERGEASSSQVSGETSTGTTTSEEPPLVRGVKRKARDSQFNLKPRSSRNATAVSSSSSSAGAGPSASSSAPGGPGGSFQQSSSSFISSMRSILTQLESMVWRARARNAQRNFRLSRFIRQREERMLRNLWDTESSHESGREEQSEADNSQPSGANQPNEDSTWLRESIRLRARRILSLMVDNLRLFFENDNLNQRTSNEALHDRIYNLYMLLQLALNLTDLLLTQLASSRNELEYRRRNISTHVARDHDYFRNRQRCLRITTTPDAWRRIRRSTVPEPHESSSQSQSTTPTTPTGLTENQRDPTQRIILGRGPRGLPHRHQAVFSNIRNSLFSQRISVPVVHVNGLPAPPVENNPPPRPPYSPPPYPIDTSGNHYVLTPRFLHPRYVGPNPFDESTSEDSSPQERQDSYLRGFGSSSVFLNDTPVSPHHRIQAWDFSKYNIPDISNVDKNIVVSECKIHNDASVDVSHDGRMLVTLLPSGRLSITTMLGVYSLQWDTLGQLLYTTSFEQNAVSVSISPTTRHLVVGLASRRSVLINNERYPNAQVYKLEKGTSVKKAFSKARGKLVHVKDLELSHNFALMSLNCIRWAPNPGQGLVYGTNTGQLKIIR